MLLETLRVGPLGVNCYIAGDENTREVIVIDPGGNVREIVDALRQMRARVRAIVLTHAHFDHVMGLTGIKNDTGAPVWIGEKEEPVLTKAEEQARFFGLVTPPPPPPDTLLKDGDEFRIGSVGFRVIATPGHSPGSICLYAPDNDSLFSGDTLMRGGIGRTDLPGGSMADELLSIRGKLLTLPPETRVYPGHGPVTTIAEEKAFNLFLKNIV